MIAAFTVSSLTGLLILLLTVAALALGALVENRPPDEVDRSNCKNNPAAQGSFLLQVVIPRLNHLIKTVKDLYQALQTLHPEGDQALTDAEKEELKTKIKHEVIQELGEEGFPVQGDFEGDGLGSTQQEAFPEDGNVTPAADPTEEVQARMDDVQKLGPLLQDLDSRGAENLSEAGLADPDELRRHTDEELQEVNYIGEEGVERIREDFPYEGDPEEGEPQEEEAPSEPAD